MVCLLTVDFIVEMIFMFLFNCQWLIQGGEGRQDDLAKIITGALRLMVEASNVALESDQWTRVLFDLVVR